ncbi:MAG: RNase A-like domain-containing protein, partial [Cyanobacteria bacterium J06638_20]
TGQAKLDHPWLHHYKTRAFNNQMQAFMQPDTIGLAGGPNLYAYLGGDGVNFTDPMGTDKTCTGSRVRRPDNYNCATGPSNVVCAGNCNSFYGFGPTGAGGGRWVATEIGVETRGDTGTQAHDGWYSGALWIPSSDFNFWAISFGSQPQASPYGNPFYVNLFEHESLGGHTISRHVGKSDSYLRRRLTSDQVLAASSFFNVRTAQSMVNAGISHNSDAIRAWLNNTNAVPIGRFDMTAGRSIGRICESGYGCRNAVNVEVRLLKRAGAPGGFIVLTAFPF